MKEYFTDNHNSEEVEKRSEAMAENEKQDKSSLDGTPEADTDNFESSDTTYTEKDPDEPTENLGSADHKKHKKSPRKKFAQKSTALLVTGGVIISGVFGFGGGMLASNLNSSNGVMYQSVRQVSDSGDENKDGAMTTEQVAEATMNSVVEIRTESVVQNQYLQQAISEGAGSGVILSTDGYIVTNNHVIDGANKITVTTKDGQSYEGTLIGTDSQSDIALLKIDATDLSAAVMGDSDQLSVGETVVAIGNPLGELGGTVTDGIVSALNREITIDGETMNLMQTNAAINPGNSGGGLFNEYGELIGIVDAKSTGEGVEGLGFAIPINDAKTVVESLKTNGYVTGRPALGVSLVDITSAEAAMQYRVSDLGVYVAEVTEGSGAANAGIQAGDRIVAVDGKEVSSASEIKSAISDKNVGDKVSIQVSRNGQMTTMDVTLGEQQKVS